MEQIELLEASTNYTYYYKCIAACAKTTHHIIWQVCPRWGATLFRKNTRDDIVTDLEETDSDLIVGIRCDFNVANSLFILCIYLLPSSSHNIEEFNDYLWALYDSLSTKMFCYCNG